MNIAIKIEEIFDTPIVEAIDPLMHDAQCQRKTMNGKETFLSDLERIGMELHAMHRAPFQALAFYDEDTILMGYGPAQKVVRRAALIGNISEVTKTRAMCVITDYRKQKRVGRYRPK